MQCPNCNTDSSFTKQKNLIGSKMICDECGHKMKYYDYQLMKGSPSQDTTISIKSSNKNSDNQNVTITNIDMDMMDMIAFMVKWAIASIPAIIILFLIWMMVMGVFGVGIATLFK